MRKHVGLIFGIAIVIITVFFVVFVPNENGEFIWNSYDYARITEVDYTAVVADEPGSNGKVVITERLTFEIHAALKDNLFWELWRDLPEEYIDGVKVDYKVNYVKQIFDDGREPVVFTESPKLYWYDSDYINTAGGFGPGKWFHSKGPYDGEYNFECVLFYVDGLYRETVIFEIEYELYNASLRYADSSELYISLYSGSNIKFLKSFKGQMLFPSEKMPGAGNYDAYTYGTSSHIFAFTESAVKNPGYHTFSFELNESQLKFRPYNQYIEFALISYGEDKHIFTQYASKNAYYNDNLLDKIRQEQAKYEAIPKIFKIVKVITVLLFSAGTFLTIMLVFGSDRKVKTKYSFYQPAMQMDYFRDIPGDLDPNFAASLVFCKHKSSDNIKDGYSAVMLNLVRKGYIELDKIKPGRGWNSKNVKIIVKYKDVTVQPQEEAPGQEQITAVNIKPLNPTEEQYFNLIRRHSNGTDISLRSFQKKVSEDYENTYSFVKNIKNEIINIGVSQGYFQNAEYQKPKKQVMGWALTLLIIGVLLITAGNLISYQTRLDLAFGSFFILGIGFIAGAAYLNKLSKKYILLTQFGEDEYAKWRGLYNFLNSETLIKERTVVELILWENYLIYATAFGISKKVIKALEVLHPNTDTSPVLRNRYYRSRVFYHSSRSFRTATRSASYTARSGGHGGYGGGGRGGGGGGGGH